MKLKTFLIKHSAIGDVALACRALKELSTEYELDLELHWLIDRSLSKFAQTLLNFPKPIPKLNVVWHTLNAQKLFNGSLLDKALQTARISKAVLKTQPNALIILHRDKRYWACSRPAFTGRLLQIKHQTNHELDIYLNTFRQLFDGLSLKRISAPTITYSGSPKNKVGILVGGGQNAKVSFNEKRWPTPKYIKLVEKILNETQKSIYLFGGPADLNESLQIEASLPKNDRIFNFVGKTSLHELPEVFADLDVFISVDSGLAHIASCVMTQAHQKILSLFGPTDPTAWGPKAFGESIVKIFYQATPCSPCYKNDGNFVPCKHQRSEYYQYCMSGIEVDSVFKELAP